MALGFGSAMSDFSRAGASSEVLSGAAVLANKMGAMRLEGVVNAAVLEQNGTTPAVTRKFGL